MPHPDDGKFVAVQNGQRISGTLHESQAAAQAEADKAKTQRPVKESTPAEQAPKVAQNLYGAIMVLLVPSLCAITFTNL